MGEAQALEATHLMFAHRTLEALFLALRDFDAPDDASELAEFGRALADVDVNEDLNAFVRAHRTGRPTPPRHVFEQWVPGMVNDTPAAVHGSEAVPAINERRGALHLLRKAIRAKGGGTAAYEARAITLDDAELQSQDDAPSNDGSGASFADSGSAFGSPMTDSSAVGSPRIARATAVFGLHLGQLMRRQREKPELEHWELPRVLVWLCDRIIFFDGHLCEGILRQSGSAADTSSIRAALNAGREPSASESSQNAHVYATLLKQWLRELASPVVPHEKYDELINDDIEKVAVSDALDLLPDINRKVLAFVVRFIREYMLLDKVIAHTKMDATNMVR